VLAARRSHMAPGATGEFRLGTQGARQAAPRRRGGGRGCRNILRPSKSVGHKKNQKNTRKLTKTQTQTQTTNTHKINEIITKTQNQFTKKSGQIHKQSTKKNNNSTKHQQNNCKKTKKHQTTHTNQAKHQQKHKK